MNQKSKKICLAFCLYVLIAPYLVSAQQLVEVPSLVGLNYLEAIEELKKAKLKKGEVSYVNKGCEFQKDQVSKHSPSAGMKVRKKSKINLEVNEEKQVLVPLVLGLTPNKADKILSAIGLQGLHGYRHSRHGRTMSSGCCQSVPDYTTKDNKISDTSPKLGENMVCQDNKTQVTTFRRSVTYEKCIEVLDPPRKTHCN